MNLNLNLFRQKCYYYRFDKHFHLPKIENKQISRIFLLFCLSEILTDKSKLVHKKGFVIFAKAVAKRCQEKNPTITKQNNNQKKQYARIYLQSILFAFFRFNAISITYIVIS